MMKMRQFKHRDSVSASQVRLIEGNRVLFDDDEEDSDAVTLHDAFLTVWNLKPGDYVTFDKNGEPEDVYEENYFKELFVEVKPKKK